MVDEFWDGPARPDDAVIEWVARAWIRVQARDEDHDPEEGNHWAVAAVIEVGNHPEIAWRMFETLCDLADPACEPVVNMIEAGPLWDLIHEGGDESLNRLERMAESSPL